MISSVMSEGLAGMQQSQRKMQQAAQDLVQAGMPTDAGQHNPGATGAVPVSNAGTSVNDLPAAATVEAAQASTRTDVNEHRDSDVVRPLVEQIQQRLVFDASANIVQSANDSLGRLIDDLS